MKIIKLLFIFLFSHAIAVAQSYDSNNLKDVIGCYDVVMAETFAEIHIPPPNIKLTADTHYANQDIVQYKVQAISENNEIKDGITWRWQGKDSFIISWSTGFQGFTMELTLGEFFPLGLATRTSDLHIEGIDDNSTIVQLGKIKCNN